MRKPIGRLTSDNGELAERMDFGLTADGKQVAIICMGKGEFSIAYGTLSIADWKRVIDTIQAAINESEMQ